MAKPPKRPRDPNQLAKAIVDIATGEKREGAINDRAFQKAVDDNKPRNSGTADTT